MRRSTLQEVIEASRLENPPDGWADDFALVAEVVLKRADAEFEEHLQSLLA
jgi:hypothetical protein